MKSGRSQPYILLEKVMEQACLAERLISMIPPWALEWRPQILAKSAALQRGVCPTDNRETELPIGEARPEAANPPGEHQENELMRLGDLLGHLLECMAGFCALLYSLKGQKLAHFDKLRSLEVNHFCGIQEAQTRMRDYMKHIEEGFALLEDADLGKMLPTVFVPEGEPVLALLLGNLEHLINHKYQLFLYLRLLGAPLDTTDLYRIRGTN